MKKYAFKHVGLSLAALAVASIAAPAYAQTIDTPPADDEVLSTVPIVKPKAGNLDPFAGNIDPFGGNIDPFAGNIDPFGGNIDPFAGNLDPFGGNIDPFGGNIDPFAGTTALSTASVSAFWTQFASGWQATASTLASLKAAPAGTTQQAAFSTNLNALVSTSAQFWGERVTRITGKTFRAGFADKLFAKYGVSLDNPASFAALTDSQRNRLAFDWYDGLMDFAGIDHVDHWMGQVRWNPTLTTIQGGGGRSLIGIIDSNLGAEISSSGNLTSSTGSLTDVNGHGAGVASLILAPHDRKGVQGIAPGAKVVTYNPFDSTGTANWSNIRSGIVDLKNKGASVINLSLGVAGWTFNPDWRPVFASRSVKNAIGTPVFVIAAGNDGATQTANVPWYNTNNPALLLVGSVDANSQISSFSNRPGTACLVTALGVCNAGAKLADRFLVAPGELILVSDGNLPHRWFPARSRCCMIGGGGWRKSPMKPQTSSLPRQRIWVHRALMRSMAMACWTWKRRNRRSTSPICNTRSMTTRALPACQRLSARFRRNGARATGKPTVCFSRHLKRWVPLIGISRCRFQAVSSVRKPASVAQASISSRI
jgi:hypothetical protein